MAITFDLPADVEKKLRAQTPNLESDIKLAYVLALFRRGRISHQELSQVLGLDRSETDAFLKRHEILEGSLTFEDIEADRRTLDGVLGRKH